MFLFVLVVIASHCQAWWDIYLVVIFWLFYYTSSKCFIPVGNRYGGFLPASIFCRVNIRGTCFTLLDMAGHLPNDNSTAVHGHSLLADETAVLFSSMVPHPHVTLCWSHCVRRGTGFALDIFEWRT